MPDNKAKQEQKQQDKQGENLTMTDVGSAKIENVSGVEIETSKDVKLLDERNMEVYDQKRYPGINRSEFQRYYETLAADAQKYINRLATMNTWTLKIDVNDSANNDDAVPNYQLESFTYNPVNTKVWRNIEQQTALITDLERKEAIIMQNAQVEANKTEREQKNTIDEQELGTLRFNIAERRANLYLYCAQKYLSMTKVQYENSLWNDIRPVLEACMFRTLHPVDISQNLQNYSGTA